jgi:hypothetical protein
VVAFPPPPVTFPATRLMSEDVSDIAPKRLFLSDWCHSFLSERPQQRSEDQCLAKPFGFDLRCNSSIDPLDVPSNLTSPLSRLSSGRSKAHKHFDYECILHPKNTKSSRKYFRFCRIRACERGACCGKKSRSIVDKTVEKFWGQGLPRWQLGVIYEAPFGTCGNHKIRGVKKNKKSADSRKNGRRKREIPTFEGSKAGICDD